MKQQQERALLAAFNRMKEKDRAFLLRLAKSLAADAPNKRPTLRLVETTPGTPTQH